jgi:hypothetical protein
MGLARIANAQLFYDRYKNRDRNEKEGQPNSVSLLISALLSDWCGGGDLNPYPCGASTSTQRDFNADKSGQKKTHRLCPLCA